MAVRLAAEKHIMILRNVGILSCGKMGGAIGAGLGLALGSFFTLISLVATVLQNFTSRVSSQESIFMIGAVVFLPVVYGVMGFAVGIVSAFSYNLASSRLGGVEFDIVPPVQ